MLKGPHVQAYCYNIINFWSILNFRSIQSINKWNQTELSAFSLDWIYLIELRAEMELKSEINNNLLFIFSSVPDLNFRIH